MARVKKGWYVVGEVATTPPLTDGTVRYRTVKSRLYSVIDAARTYAEMLEKSGVCRPGSVMMLTKEGNDKITD